MQRGTKKGCVYTLQTEDCSLVLLVVIYKIECGSNLLIVVSAFAVKVKCERKHKPSQWAFPFF